MFPFYTDRHATSFAVKIRRSLRRADDFWQAILTQHLGGRRLGKAIENGDILAICYDIDIVIIVLYIYMLF